MTDSAQNKKEVVLAEITGLIHDGILATPGTITLTKASLKFVPTNTYRMLGIKGLRISVSSIQGAEVEGINQLLKVQTDTGVRTFSGSQVKVIRDRIVAMVDKANTTTGEFELDERIIGVFDAERPVNKLMSAEGQLVVTGQRVYFQPGAVGGLVWGKTKFSLRYSEITDIQANIRKKQITFSSSGDTYVVECGDLAEAYGTICCLRDRHELSGRLSFKRVEVHKVFFHRGALAVRGYAAITAKRITFLPSGLDRLAGSADLYQVVYSDIETVSRDREDKTRLIISTSEGTAQISFEDVRHVLLAIGQRLAYAPSRSELAITASTQGEDLESVLVEQWGEQLNTSSGEVSFFSPTTYISKRGSIQRGWLLVRGIYVHWIPAEKVESGRSALTMPVRQMHTVDTSASAAHVIEYAMRGDRYIFVCRNGASAQEQFWAVIADARKEMGVERTAAEIEQMNRREVYRVLSSGDGVAPTIDGEIRSKQSGSRRFKAQLIDFSFGGCALVVKSSIAKAGATYLLVKAGVDAKFIRASVVYERKLSRIDGYRVGIRFQPKDSAETKLLRAAWMRMQRSAAVVRSEEYWSIFEDSSAGEEVSEVGEE